MIHLKGCQRCGGDVIENSDKDGEYMECLQCGHMTYPENPTESGKKRDSWRKKKRETYYY